MKASFLTNRVTRTWMMGLCLLAAPASQASSVKVLDPRLSTVKPTSPELEPETPVQRLVVKFHEGTRVRLRGGTLQVLSAERNPSEHGRMRGAGSPSTRCGWTSRTS
jgi:serine protease